MNKNFTALGGDLKNVSECEGFRSQIKLGKLT